ncbi:YbjQ family protein [Streptomyces sp. DSM 40750]|uniref:YbjQ family protein n=1 Tax=Streptomyces sp. DSM 40750 TaxID=2801030 RepID=UPI00214BF5B0|nr:YbjQ family protein [Streptomyces sp. DSM 40750]UUU23847.1 YbjQ family protein [Streptomyces sp. DSM 40750]
MSPTRAEKKERQLREQQLKEAYSAHTGFYSATLDAPPHPHTALGLAVGGQQLSAIEAVVSMQAYARARGADGVLGVSICSVPTIPASFVAYGTAVKWAEQAEEE